MKSSKRFLTLLIAIVLFGFTVQSLSARPVYVKKTPPARKVVVKPAKPHHNAIWVKGHWSWKKDSYKWVGGHWLKSKPGYIWVDGHWKKTKHGWIRIAGHWKKK